MAGGWQVRTGSLVGVVRVGDVEIRIRPKVTVQRLLFLLSYGGDGWRDEEVLFEGVADHVDAVAYAFTAHAERALRRGVLQGYVSRDEALPVLRGRLRAGDQLAARFGLPLPVEVAFDDYTPDIFENQLLAAAATHLLRSRDLPPLRRRLRHLLATLEGVTRWPPGVPAPSTPSTRLNARYQPALALARLILERSSFRFAVGEVTATGLLFDMNRVFEQFLARALGGALARRGGTSAAQHVSALDEAGAISLRPDLTWWIQGRCHAVIDAKYKVLDSGATHSGDLYQLLAYCTAYGLQHGHLVYTTDAAVATARHRVTNTQVTLHVHALDLDRPPDALLAEIDGLAQYISNEAQGPWGQPTERLYPHTGKASGPPVIGVVASRQR